MNKFLAKSDGTTLIQHIEDVVINAKKIIEKCGIKDDYIIKSIIQACVLHDAGKSIAHIQRILKNKESTEIPEHSYISTKIAKKCGATQEAIYATNFHHGVPVPGNCEYEDSEIDKIVSFFQDILKDYKKEGSEQQDYIPSYLPQGNLDSDTVSKAAKQRIVLAILCAADWMASGSKLKYLFTISLTIVTPVRGR